MTASAAVLPIVAIVGRPNVGKSTLFNRIVGERLAIVEDVAGVTRDRLYREGQWLDRRFLAVDTGGITLEDDPIKKQVGDQARLAIDEADVIIFVVDGKEGLHPLDQDVANILRRTSKPVILAINKVDHYDPLSTAEFYALGFGEGFPISAEHALGIGDLLDRVLKNFPPELEEEETEAIRVALIGRPNAGKSSILNAILGEERVIVSPIPGTTRDAIDTGFCYEGQDYILVDTAGIRRKARVEEAVEYYSIVRALRAVERTDVTLMVLDATDFSTEQDKRVAGIAQEAGKAVIIVVNKWDLIKKSGETAKNFTEELRYQLAFLNYAPVLFVSAKTGKGINRILPEVAKVANEYTKRIPTNILNNVVRDAIALHHPPSRKGKQLKIYYAAQLKVKPPTFQLWVNDPELMHFSYERFLENRLRDEFGFTGSPLRFILKKRAGKGGK
ncbi:MAG TPA: ribosome biogenesis GTPase Der [Firmicutes bacterium]|nr:ribosome biogenesis GTPase Der [Bacillota bacterium]